MDDQFRVRTPSYLEAGQSVETQQFPESLYSHNPGYFGNNNAATKNPAEVSSASQQPVYASLNNVNQNRLWGQVNHTQPASNNHKSFGGMEDSPPNAPTSTSTRCSYCYDFYIKTSTEYQYHLSYFHRHAFNTCEMQINHETVKEPTKYTCSICFKNHPDKGSVKLCTSKHKIEENKDEPTEFKCSEDGCQLVYKIKKSLQAHMRAKHKSSFCSDTKDISYEWKCQFCNRLLSCSRRLLVHEELCYASPENKKKKKEKKLTKKKAKAQPAAQLHQDPPQPLANVDVEVVLTSGAPSQAVTPFHAVTPFQAVTQAQALPTFQAVTPFQAVTQAKAVTQAQALPTFQAVTPSQAVTQVQALPTFQALTQTQALPTLQDVTQSQALTSHIIDNFSFNLIETAQEAVVSLSQKSHESVNSEYGMLDY